MLMPKPCSGGFNNGYMSDQFQIQKGVRQGCPLSSSLFIKCLQVLTNYIKLNKYIEGIKVGDEEIKQSLYAASSDTQG